jgi:hypothetical protein
MAALGSSTNRKAIKCFKCGGMGHIAGNCRSEGKGSSKQCDKANKAAMGLIDYFDYDEEITEQEWKEQAKHALKREDGWGNEESEDEGECEEDGDHGGAPPLDLDDGLIHGANCFCLGTKEDLRPGKHLPPTRIVRVANTIP